MFLKMEKFIKPNKNWLYDHYVLRNSPKSRNLPYFWGYFTCIRGREERGGGVGRLKLGVENLGCIDVNTDAKTIVL